MAWKFEHSGCRKKRDIDNRISKKRLEKKILTYAIIKVNIYISLVNIRL